MNIKALITTFAIVGSSSVAMARPVTVSAEASWEASTPVVRDHGTAPGYQYSDGRARRNDRRGVLLAERIRIADGETRKFIDIGANKGAFRSLSIAPASGSMMVTQVRIDFVDGGESQIVKNINMPATRKAALNIDLAGNRREVARIIVYGENSSRRRSNVAFNIVGY